MSSSSHAGLMHYVGQRQLSRPAYGWMHRRQSELQARLGRQLQVLLAGCGHDRSCDSSDHRSDGRALTPSAIAPTMAPRPAPPPTLRAVRLPSPLPCATAYSVTTSYTRSPNEIEFSFRAIWSLPFKVPDCLTLATWIRPPLRGGSPRDRRS